MGPLGPIQVQCPALAMSKAAVSICRVLVWEEASLNTEITDCRAAPRYPVPIYYTVPRYCPVPIYYTVPRYYRDPIYYTVPSTVFQYPYYPYLLAKF